MLEYVLKRVGMAFLTVLIIACITFLMMNAIPGSPFLNERSQPPEVLAALEAKYGLDKPLYQQLWNYLTSFVQGDMGVSLKMQKNRDVAEIIFEKFPVSVKVGGWAILNAIVCGIPLGCIAAYNRGKWVDSLLRIITTAGVAIPSFVVCTVLLIVFGVKLSLLPTMGLDSWQNYLMPCFALSFYPMCYIARLMRSSMLDVINQDYIRTARAKGVAPVMLIFKHALRNSLIPVITYLGPMVAYTVTGGFVVETVFSIPGLGRYFIQSILARDYPIIMGTTIFLSILIIVMNLLVDIAYKIVDPRISFTKGGE